MDNLTRIGKVELPEIYAYSWLRENRCSIVTSWSLHFSNKRWLTEEEVKAGREV